MEAPKIPSFIKQNKSKRFEYKPWFYDERKERMKKMKAENPEKNQGSEERRVNLADHWTRHRRHASSKQSNLRLVLIASFLFLIAYFLIFR